MKKYIACVFAVIIAATAMACSSGSSDSSSSVSSSSKPVSSAVSVAASSSSKVVTQADKKSATDNDNKIMDIVTKSEKTTQILQQACGEVGKGNGTTLDLYDIAKQASKNQDNYFSDLCSIDDKSNEKYVSACENYVLNSQTVAKDLMKYLDKGEMKYMSKAEDCLKDSESYALEVVTERTNYLSSQGFSDSEIAKILSASASSTASK